MIIGLSRSQLEPLNIRCRKLLRRLIADKNRDNKCYLPRSILRRQISEKCNFIKIHCCAIVKWKFLVSRNEIFNGDFITESYSVYLSLRIFTFFLHQRYYRRSSQKIFLGSMVGRSFLFILLIDSIYTQYIHRQDAGDIHKIMQISTWSFHYKKY